VANNHVWIIPTGRGTGKVEELILAPTVTLFPRHPHHRHPPDL